MAKFQVISHEDELKVEPKVYPGSLGRNEEGFPMMVTPK